MKKITAICLASFCLLLLINSSGWAGSQLTIWMGKSFIPASNKILEEQVQKWASENDVDAKIEWFAYGDMDAKLLAAIETGTTPDIAELQVFQPVRFHNMGVLLGISDVATEVSNDMDGILDSVLAAVKFGGEFYALPRYIIPSVVFWRKDLLEAAGIKEPPGDLDSTKAALQKLYNPDKEIYAFGVTYNTSDDGFAYIHDTLQSWGASWTDETGQKVTLNSPAAVAAVKYMAELNKFAPPGVMGWTDATNNQAYLAGKTAYTHNGPSILYQMTYPEESPLLKQSVITLKPSNPEGKRFMTAFQYSWGIFKNTQHPELAKKLIAYTMKYDQYKQYQEAALGQFAPAYPKAFNDPFWQKTESLKVCRDTVNPEEQVLNFYGYPGPLTVQAAEVRARNILTDMMGRVVGGKLSPEEAVAEAHARIREIYSR